MATGIRPITIQQACQCLSDLTGAECFLLVGRCSTSLISPKTRPLSASSNLRILPLDPEKAADPKTWLRHLGEGSDFHQKTGRYLKATSLQKLEEYPPDWEIRCNRTQTPEGLQILCVHPLDLAYHSLHNPSPANLVFVQQLLHETDHSIEDLENFIETHSVSPEKEKQRSKAVKLLLTPERALHTITSQAATVAGELSKHQIPLSVDLQVSTSPRPYLCACYNEKTLEKPNIWVNGQEIQSDWASFTQEEFAVRLRTGLREETIHLFQIDHSKRSFEELSKTPGSKKYPNPEALHKGVYTLLFEELSKTEKGKKLLVNSAQAYHANLNIKSVAGIRANNRRHKTGNHYTTVELVRQLTQIALGDVTSEEGRGPAWDKYQYYGAHAHKNQLQELLVPLREAALNPERLSPLLDMLVKNAMQKTQGIAGPKSSDKTPQKSKVEPELEPA